MQTPDTIDTKELFVPAKRPAVDDGRVFKLHSEFSPAGDQPQAIAELTKGIQDGENNQVLLGVTGSGKTFTMAHVIQNIQRPALVLAPNKTLAAQLYGEMKEFFPENAVEYFVSYYDYYQPEAYVPRSDTYIEKDASVNEQIDRMRHAATRSLMERGDVIIAINGEKVRNVDEAIAILKGFRVDAEYVLTIVRHGKTFDLQLKPEERSRRRQWY